MPFSKLIISSFKCRKILSMFRRDRFLGKDLMTSPRWFSNRLP
jgi:hypothetical protein